MSEDILDDLLKKIRETGETSFVPGPLDRGVTSQNPDGWQNLNIERVADRAKQGFSDAKGRTREIGGKVYLNPERTSYVPYYKDATDALLNPTAMNAFSRNAPYYATIAATSLYGGGLVAAAGEGAAAIAGAGALGTSAMHIGGFLAGAGGTAYATQQGLGAMGFNGPTPYEQLTQAGPLAATATGIGLATFRPGLPGSMDLLKKQAVGGALFAGGVGIEEAGRAAIGKATGTDERPASKIIAEGALHMGEAFLFGVAMKPTVIGEGLIQAGRSTANAGNVLPSMIASSQFGGGLFRSGPSPLDIRGRIIPAREPGIVVNEDLTETFDPGSPARRVGDAPYVQQNTRGRGGVVLQNGVPVAGEMVPTTPAEPGQTGVSTQTQNSTLRPSKTGRGDMTSFDPATGAGLKIEVLPNGDVQYTLFTNLGGAALKAKGPYKDLPDQFRVGHHDMVRANFDARMAASEAARQEAVWRAAGAKAKTQSEVPPVPAAEAATPPPPAPAPKPVVPPTAPVVPPTVTPPAPPSVAPVVAPRTPAQQAYETTQQEERDAGRESQAAEANLIVAQAAHEVNPTSESSQNLALARATSARALEKLERAQMAAEKAAQEKKLRDQDVEPRPKFGEPGSSEWAEKYERTHSDDGKRFNTEDQKRRGELLDVIDLENKFKKDNKIESPKAEDYSDKDLSAGRRRVIPLYELPVNLQERWKSMYGEKYNVDGYAKKYPATPKPAPGVLADVPDPPAPVVTPSQENDPMWIPIPKGHVRPYPEDSSSPGARETWVQMHGKTHNFDGTPIASVKPKVAPAVAPATREELLAGTRAMKDAPKEVVEGLTPEERKTYIANRAAVLEGRPVTPPAAAAGEVVVAATATETSAVEAAVKPDTAVDTPTQAATKVGDEIERLIDLGDAKTAGDVHRKVINTLTELSEHVKTIKPYTSKEKKITSSRTGIGKVSLMLDDVEAATIKKVVKKSGQTIYLIPNALGRSKGIDEITFKSKDDLRDINMADEARVIKHFEDKIRKEESLNNDPRKYVIRIPGDGTFSVKQNATAIETLLQQVRSQGPSAWQGIVSKTPPRKETPRFKPFSAVIPAQERKLLVEMIRDEKSLLENTTSERPEGPDGRTRAEIEQNVTSLQEALRNANGPTTEENSKTPAIPDPQGRKNVLVQSAVVGERDKDTDRLQVVGVDGPSEIHRRGMQNPEPLELESPGGKSSESWVAYQSALEREGAKNVYIVRLPGTKEGGKSYNMAITGFVSIKFKKGQGGGVIPVLNSVGSGNDNMSTKHWLNWKIIEFYPEVTDNRAEGAEKWIYGDPRYSSNLAESGGKVFGEIENTTEAKKAFVARLFATFEVLVPGGFEREDSTYGFDGKPTLYFNQSAMIEAEKAELAKKEIPKPEDASPKEMTVAEHWQVEKDREEAAQKVRTPIASEAPEGAKSKAQIQAEAKVEGAKRYGASGVRFNIGGPKNPDSFGGEIRGEKGVVVASTSENWNEKDLKLIKDYLSADAAVLRNMGYPKFYFNSHISGEDSNWVSAPVPAANGNFLVYELNPAGSGAKGNSHNRTSRLFRRLVNSDGVQVGSMTEIYRGELVGMTTTSMAADGKPKFQVPAAFHAMMAAAQDSLASRQMTEGQVNYSGDVTNPNPLNKRIALSGAIHEDLKVFEENELSIPGLRDKMEVFNGLNGGESINLAIVQFMGNPNESTAAMLASQLQTNALYAAADARSLIDQMGAQMGLADGTYALVSEPHSDDLYPIMKAHKIYPTEAQLMLKWIEAGYQRIIYEIGKHNEDTGEELPDKVPAMLNGKPRMLPNGKPMMINNPMKWNAPVAPWMDAETFAVRDKDGKVTFMPKPHQVVGPNAAMSRWFPAGVVSAPRWEGVQPRAILINDAPGTGKTLQMLMSAVLYRQHLMKLIADPSSPWFGAKLQPVLIVTQNAQIIQNAFRGDAEMAKINLNGKFTDKGFEPDEYELLPDGGRILTGNSWIDIATYNSIKPVEEKVLQFEKDGKTPLMVDAFVRDEDGEIMKGPDGKGMPLFDPVKVDKDGIPVRLKEQAFKLLAVGPPKKGYGRWGVVMFDESHNMKNQESGRSDAGFEIMAQAQHVMLASGTPIDKPTQLGPLLGMLLDVPIKDIAEELGMRLTEEERDERVTHIKRVEGSDIVLERPTLNFGSVPWSNPTELDTYFNGLFLKLKMLRDRAGRGGAILRRSTKYFGIENIWMDPSDTMHEAGRDLLMKMHEWWYEEMAAAAEGGGSTGLNVRTLKGMMLFEMKRAAALAKIQLPGTIWNPGSEPLGAAKLLLEELAEGRKVILTMDTSNEYGLADTDKIRTFRGLKDENGKRLAYESEYVLWSKFLTERGIRFGIIKGGIKTSEREAFVAEYQKNNPDLSVIIMTTMSGGTGLSIDDRHGVGGRSNPKKQYTPAELDKMKQIAAEEVEGEKIVSGSFPRTMIIVSSPWGGDVFIQAMGRTDRLLSTTPSRIIVLTTGLSEGDDKLIGLVRLKTMAVEAMNNSVSKGDALMGAVIMDAGLEAGGVEGLAGGGVHPVKEMDGVEAAELTKEQKAAQSAFYKNKSKNILRRHRAMAMSVATANEGKIANAEKNRSSNRELKRWRDSASLAREYVQYLDDISAKFLSGQISDTAIITGEKDHSFEEFKKRKAKTRGEESYEDEDGLVDDNNMTLSFPFGSSTIPTGQGPQISLTKLSPRGKVSKARKAIDGIYGVHHTISGGKSVTPETLERIEKTVVSIAEPYIKLNSEGKLEDRELTAILRMASDVSKLIYRYDFLINTGDKKLDVDYGGQMSFTGRAIMSNLTGIINGETATNTAFHEIGHAIWESMPEPEKLLVIEELKLARTQWQQELEDTNPLKSVVFPTVNWLRGEGSENYDWSGRVVKRPPVPYADSKEYQESVGSPSAQAPFGQGVHFANKLVGPQLVARAFKIAAKNAILAGWTKSVPNIAEKASDLAPTANRAIGNPGQYDITETGSTPAERSTRALVSLLQLAVVEDNKKAQEMMLNGVLVNVTSLKTGKAWSGTPVSLGKLIEWSEGGFGHFAVQKDGSLVFTTKGSVITDSEGQPFISTRYSRPGINSPEYLAESGYAELQILQMNIPGKDIYTMFVKSFGKMSSSSRSGEGIFRGPEFLEKTNVLSSAPNSFTQFLNGVGNKKLQGYTYSMANVDEWTAHNAAELYEDFYTKKSNGNLSDLTGSITASLYVHANANGRGSVVKGIIAALTAGTMEPSFGPEKDFNISGTHKHSQLAAQERQQAQQSGSTSPPTDAQAVTDSNSKVPQYGPARRKLESATEGLEAMATAFAQNTLDFAEIPQGSIFREWLENVRRRKFKTGLPDRVTGTGIGYKFSHVYGTLIGQVEQIGQITKDPFVIDLSSRLYPSGINTGINVRPSLVEDIHAHTMFWNNRVNEILERTLGDKIDNAKENKIRTLKPDPHTLPGFRDALVEYILKVHDPEYNKLERIQFEIDANQGRSNKKLDAEMKLLGVGVATIKKQMAELRRLATIDADSYGQPGSKYTNVAFGREADHFLGKYMGETGVDKLFMDVGRCMVISQTSPEYATRAQRFDPEVIACADELSQRWAGEYLSWAQTQGNALSEWGSSFLPRVVDSNIVSSYGNSSGEDFTLTAAKAIIEDNNYQRVKLPSTLKALVEDMSVSKLIVDEAMLPHVSRQEVYDRFDALPGEPKAPGWMLARAEGLFKGATMASSFMGYDVSCRTLVEGRIPEKDEDGEQPETEETTIAAHISVNLNLYKRELEREARAVSGSVKKAMAIRQFKDEYEYVIRAINDLAESHKRKVLAGPISHADALAVAKKWRFRIDNRATGVQGGGETGYNDLISGQGGSLKRPDSGEMRLMDTEAADRILDRFYIRDPRIIIPMYNQSVTSNLMIKKHIPEGFFNALHRSVVSNPNTARYWPELTYLIAKIAGVTPNHDSSTALRSLVALGSSAAFMPVTSMLQLTEAIPAGLHAPSGIASEQWFPKLLGLTKPGVFATADTLKIAFLKSTNSVITALTPLQTDAMLPHADKFMYRLAERSGIIMSTLMDDLPMSSADPRTRLGRFTDHMIQRYHQSGSALATVTNMSRVAVLKANVLMLETTADDILLRELARYGSQGLGATGAPTVEEFVKLLKPHEILLFRNLGIPDSELKSFLLHALSTRAITDKDISKIPSHAIDAVLNSLIDSAYTEGNKSAELYSNAINRLNFLTIQRSIPANMSRLRGLVDRHVGVFPGSFMFFLTNFSSAYGRNVVLPSARLATGGFTKGATVAKAGQQEGIYRRGVYSTDVAYPISRTSTALTMIPALAMLVASSTLVNYGTRAARMKIRANPASTYIDQKEIPEMIFAAIDQTGWTGNLSLPINITRALRYERETAQIAAGPFFGGMAGVVDYARTYYGDKNSPNTPTAERAFAKQLYDMLLRPMAQVGLQALSPNSTVGDIFNFTMTQTMALPAVRESFMRWFADDDGNQGQRVPVSKSDLEKAFNKGLINRKQLLEGIKRRELYDSQYKKDKAQRELNEAIQRRKEQKAK